MEKIALKSNPNINETRIQDYIFDNPSVLELGDLIGIRREKRQPAGGRIDLLLGDDANTRYEVEVQLGATDPSHIIRTIEYWDNERKRYPQYDHCAVIVAEEITGRFMNVISLFNGSVPLIAIQMSAYKIDDDAALVFTKVLDRVTYANEDEIEVEETDRNYWENKTTKRIMSSIDKIYTDVKDYAPGFELNFTKFYIGLSKDKIARNFISFQPRKNFFYLVFKGNNVSEIIKQCEEHGLEISYKPSFKEFWLHLSGADEYSKHKEFIETLIKGSMEYYNIELE